MPDYLTRDLKLAISATPETTYNAIKTAASDVYLGMLTTGRNLYIPDREKQDDTGKVGTGREFPTEQRSGYVVVPSIELTEELNIDIGARLLRRAMGGADTVGAAIAPDTFAYPHTWGVLGNNTAAGRQLPSSTVAWSLGGADYLWGGVVVESFRIDQAAAGVPTFTATLVGSGIYKRIRDIGSPPTFPAPTKQRYMLGAETQLEFNDGTNYVVTDARRLRNFSMTLANNHRTDDRRPGDPRVNSADPKGGWYVASMLHGDRTVGAEMTLMLDDNMREFAAANNDTIITSFKYRARGHFLEDPGTPGTYSTTNQAIFEITFPKCYFRTVRGGDDGGDATITVAVFPVDDLTNGPLTVRVVTNSATLIS